MHPTRQRPADRSPTVARRSRAALITVASQPVGLGRREPRRRAARSRTARTAPRPGRATRDRRRRCPPRARHEPAGSGPAWSARARRARSTTDSGVAEPRDVVEQRRLHRELAEAPRVLGRDPQASRGRSEGPPSRRRARRGRGRCPRGTDLARRPRARPRGRDRPRAPSRSPSRIFPHATSASAHRSVAPRPRPRLLRTSVISDARA